MNTSKRPVGQRVHDWLSEPEGETFRLGKWRFWFIAVAGLQLVNALLTGLIFQSAGNLQNYMGAILFGVGALVGWIAIGALHYSDAPDRTLARGVSALDSVTLLFVIAHFAFLMWSYGHLKTLQSAEAKYEQSAAIYNAKAEKLSGDNVTIARAAQTIAQETTKAERLKNDTAYQQRKTAEAGGRLSAPRSPAPAAIAGSLTTSQVELEKPTRPKQSSAEFLTDWDAWIRAANFGELLLCALTLIFIRNKTAHSNKFVFPVAEPIADTFAGKKYFSPLSASSRTPAPAANFTKRKEPSKEHAPSIFIDPEGLKRLRQTLSDISFRIPGYSFKAQPKGDALWIFMVKANKGTQETVASAKAKLEILDDAMKMRREAFQLRVEKFLNENDFELEERASN